jgi:Sensors of blue-light using FAD
MPDSVPIEQILYISTITPLATVEMSSILSSARRNNQAADITGLLLFNGKRFLQVLEGPADAVTATYARIAQDPRHRAQVVLSRKRVAQREFGDWSMAFRDGKTAPGDALYEAISAKVADAHPSLRAEVMAFARNI